MTRTSAPHLLLKLALVPVFVLAPLRVWPQEGDWDKHMKAGKKAFQSLKYAKAEVEFRAALVEAQSLPAADPRTEETIRELAEIYTRESKFAEEEELLKRDAATTETALGPDDPRLAYVLIELALNYEREDKPAEAAPLLSRSVAILKKARKPVDPGLLTNMTEAASRSRGCVGRTRQGKSRSAGRFWNSESRWVYRTRT